MDCIQYANDAFCLFQKHTITSKEVKLLNELLAINLEAQHEVILPYIAELTLPPNPHSLIC